MRMLAAVELPARTVAPLSDEPLDDPLHRSRVLVARAEVPAFGETRTIGAEPFRQHQVAAQRFQHVLPRAHGVRIADDDRLAALEMARRMSGTSRSAAQSPPPITLPARAVATATPCLA